MRFNVARAEDQPQGAFQQFDMCLGGHSRCGQVPKSSSRRVCDGFAGETQAQEEVMCSLHSSTSTWEMELVIIIL